MTVVSVVYQPAPRPRPAPQWVAPRRPRVPEQIAGELDLPQQEEVPEPAAEPEPELELDVPQQAGLPTVLAWALAPLGGAALLLWLLTLGAPLDAAALIVVAIAVAAISLPIGRVDL